MNRQAGLLESAQEIAKSVEAWADLSNALFHPVDGLISKAYPTREQRAAFLRTDEYKSIRQLIDDAVQRSGLVEGASPKKSGRFVVRLPRSLHGALEREAAEEGVSLNHLVVVKLAAQMSQIAGGPHPGMSALAQAFPESRTGYSIDRVIVAVKVTEDTLSVDLADGRTISVPLDWYPRLQCASPTEKENWTITEKGQGIHWNDLDEDISAAGLLAGKPSGESRASLKRWLHERQSPSPSD